LARSSPRARCSACRVAWPWVVSSRPEGLPSVARWAPAVRGMSSIMSPLAADLHAHAARGALDHAHGRFDRVGVEVVHLDLGDRADLRARQLPHLVLVRLARALLDAGLLADEVGGRRTLRHERVRTVLEDGHDRGDDAPGE